MKVAVVLFWFDSMLELYLSQDKDQTWDVWSVLDSWFFLILIWQTIQICKLQILRISRQILNFLIHFLQKFIKSALSDPFEGWFSSFDQLGFLNKFERRKYIRNVIQSSYFCFNFAFINLSIWKLACCLLKSNGRFPRDKQLDESLTQNAERFGFSLCFGLILTTMIEHFKLHLLHSVSNLIYSFPNVNIFRLSCEDIKTLKNVYDVVNTPPFNLKNPCAFIKSNFSLVIFSIQVQESFAEVSKTFVFAIILRTVKMLIWIHFERKNRTLLTFQFQVSLDTRHLNFSFQIWSTYVNYHKSSLLPMKTHRLSYNLPETSFRYLMHNF